MLVKDVVCIIDGIKFVIFIGEMWYYLNGIYFYVYEEDGKSLLCVVVMDGYCFVCVQLFLFEGVLVILLVIVLWKMIMELWCFFENEDEKIQFVVLENKIQFCVGLIIFIFKLIDGNFFDYEWVIFVGNDKMFKLDWLIFVSVVDCVFIILIEKLRVVKMILSGLMLMFFVNNFESGSVIDEMFVVYEFDELEIGFNVCYVLDVMF